MKKILLNGGIVAVLTLVLTAFLNRDKIPVRARAMDAAPAAPAEVTQQTRPQSSTRSYTSLLKTFDFLTDSDRRRESLERAVISVTVNDRPALLESLLRDDDFAAAELREGLIRRWAETDPIGAVAWASQISDPATRQASLKQAASAWAEKDLSSATSWLATLADGPDKQAAAIAVAYEAAKSNPLTSLKLASQLPATSDRDSLLVYAVSQWAGSDSKTATTWAAQVNDSKLRQHLLAAVSVAMAARDGLGAATLAGMALPPGPEQDRTAISIVQRWAQTSPQDAANWVAQFPNTAVRASATQNLITIWAAKDAKAAANWLNSQPAGAAREAGQSAYSQALASLNSSTDETAH